VQKRSAFEDEDELVRDCDDYSDDFEKEDRDDEEDSNE